MLSIFAYICFKVKELINACSAGKPRGNGETEFVGIFLDHGQMGESMTAPHLRHRPVDQDQMKAHRATWICFFDQIAS